MDPLSEFTKLTRASESVAKQYLARNDNDLTDALNDFYQTEKSSSQRPSAPKFQSFSDLKKPANKPKAKPGFGSFSDLMKGGDNDDDNDEMNFFTGGEKSALAVEDPNKGNLIDQLMRKAREEAGKEDWRDKRPQKKHDQFTGVGHTLGSVEQEVQSEKIGSAVNSSDETPEKVTRKITFWKEGFSVDDGDLYRYDDPLNQEYIKQLNQGRAPLSLLNVKMFQDVDVQVEEKRGESFTPVKKKRVFGFSGQGQRLGSPVPGEPTKSAETISTKHSANEEAPASVREETEGDTTIQIRLATGERFVRKFNSDDPVQVLYDYVYTVADNSRDWSLALSFPMILLDDKINSSIKEAGLKNAVVVQRWK
ncbi:protein phosphatase regulator [Martiniozyma asiatica (nom. inval.)]|nr:protein phosphatase regulator [Martiniozyma asiatica]